MSSKSKSQLRTENSNNFPNNNSQFITPEKLRGFNNDIIDSLVVSSDTGSYVTTSSFDNGTRNLTFTKADGSTYVNNIPGGGGGSTDTGSLLTTASVADATITFTKGDASQFSIEVDNVTSSLETQDVFINVKNTSGLTLAKATPVHAVGVTGENVDVIVALSGTPSTMPAIGLLNEELTNNAVGQAIISGRIKNIDTSGLVAGAAVYVGNTILGELTSTKPTGSLLIQNIGIAGKINATEGEIIVMGAGRSNDVPNIPQGQIWVGNSSGVATPTSTGSFAKIDENNTFTGNQTFNNITVNGTGSFAYIQSVTGSAKIIGDAFLILNNDTPTERYAGIKVYDSGSSNNTSSFQYDGSTDDWFFEKDVLGTAEYGIALFGPEYNTIGNPTYLTNNTIPKSDGGHHLNNSNITDDGSTVTISADLNVTGTYKGFDSGSFALLNQANTFTGGIQLASGSNNVFTSQPEYPTTPAQKVIINLNNQNAEVDGNGGYDIFQSTISHFNGFGRWYDGSLYNEALNSVTFEGAEEIFNPGGWYAAVAASGSGYSRAGQLYIQDDFDQSTSISVQSQQINIGTLTSGLYQARDGINIGSTNGQIYLNGNVNVTAPISSSTYVSASAFIGDGSQLSGVAGGIFVQTGSYYSTTNDLEVTGSFNVKGGIGGSNVDLTITSQTASLDLRESNTFTLQLVNAVDTHLTVSSFSGEGQSINVLVKQPIGGGQSGSISFSSDFKFGQGYEFIPTPLNGVEDMLSFTRFGNSLYGTYINNFS